MNELDVLRGARATLADPALPFAFGQWNQCGCGHIYAAAMGDPELLADGAEGAASDYLATADPEEPLGRALAAVLEAAGQTGPAGQLDYAVSNLIAAGWDARPGGGAPFADDDDGIREEALAAVERAIAMLETRQEADRLAVLAR